MTEQVSSARGVASDVLGAAREAAEAAASHSGVTIRQAVTLADVETVRRVYDDVWRPPADDPAVTTSVLWPLIHVGNYCAIAFDGPAAVGVCLGFLGVEPAHSLHSHAAGVTKAGAGRHIGFALKQDQRAWALGHGLTTVTWTYDPLVRRNAFFNVTRLGARPVEYLVDFYGEMTDAINAGQGSDRLMVHWDLTSDAVARCATRSIAEPESPTTPNPLSDKDVRYVQVPADIELMRREDPAEARRWRMAVRETLGDLLATGWSVVSVSREGYYELRRVG
jgi:predicted GNAT superfamily acetyltransferase